MPIFYDNPAAYIQASTDVADRINRLTNIIIGLENASLEAASNGEIASYQFNDGQSQIQTSYTSVTEIAKSIVMFETIRERLINRTQGRRTILRDANTLVRRQW